MCYCNTVGWLIKGVLDWLTRRWEPAERRSIAIRYGLHVEVVCLRVVGGGGGGGPGRAPQGR